jgi:hypothetical protein
MKWACRVDQFVDYLLLNLAEKLHWYAVSDQ